MYESERKEWNVYKWIMAIITVVLFCMSFLDLPPTMMYDYHQQAPGWAKAVGAIAFIVSIIPLLFERKISRAAKNESLWFIIWFAGMGVGIASNYI